MQRLRSTDTRALLARTSAVARALAPIALLVLVVLVVAACVPQAGGSTAPGASATIHPTQTPLVPAKPGADPISLLAWLFTPIFQVLFITLVAIDQVVHDIGISIDTGAPEGAESGVIHPQQIFVYDNYPGGIGFSAPLFRLHHELLEATRRLISECPCENGCPGCVGPIGNTGPLAKTAALRILDLLMQPAFDSARAKPLEAKTA